jgi:hypothetical protein
MLTPASSNSSTHGHAGRHRRPGSTPPDGALLLLSWVAGHAGPPDADAACSSAHVCTDDQPQPRAADAQAASLRPDVSADEPSRSEHDDVRWHAACERCRSRTTSGCTHVADALDWHCGSEHTTASAARRIASCASCVLPFHSDVSNKLTPLAGDTPAADSCVRNAFSNENMQSHSPCGTFVLRDPFELKHAFQMRPCAARHAAQGAVLLTIRQFSSRGVVGGMLARMLSNARTCAR